MGGRSRRQLPANIKIERKLSTGFYEGEEEGITYQLTYSQMNDLKDYFHLRGSGYEPRIITWYNSLSHHEKGKVKRLGVPDPPDDFFPDQEWPEH